MKSFFSRKKAAERNIKKPLFRFRIGQGLFLMSYPSFFVKKNETVAIGCGFSTEGVSVQVSGRVMVTSET
jgi:hypothetical protein